MRSLSSLRHRLAYLSLSCFIVSVVGVLFLLFLGMCLYEFYLRCIVFS